MPLSQVPSPEEGIAGSRAGQGGHLIQVHCVKASTILSMAGWSNSLMWKHSVQLQLVNSYMYYLSLVMTFWNNMFISNGIQVLSYGYQLRDKPCVTGMKINEMYNVNIDQSGIPI